MPPKAEEIQAWIADAIAPLQERIEAQEKRIEAQEKRIDTQEERIKALELERDALKEQLKGSRASPVSSLKVSSVQAKPPKRAAFSGKGDENYTDAHVFLRIFEHDHATYNEIEKTAAVANFLTGPALAWLAEFLENRKRDALAAGKITADPLLFSDFVPERGKNSSMKCNACNKGTWMSVHSPTSSIMIRSN